jgi:type I restriction enzyme S subunit
MVAELLSKFPTIKFKELIKGKPRHGIYKPPEFSGKGTKIVKMGTQSACSFINEENIPDLLEVSKEEIDRFGIFADDLLFLRTSLVMEGTGKCSIVMKLTGPAVFVSNLIAVTLDKTKANPLFYYYYFSSDSGRQNVLSLCEQTAASTIRSSDLQELVIPFPKIEEQNKIADVLYALDRKIKLNQEMNNTLESIGQAVFKRWFVDFEFPNEEGKPYKSSGGEMDSSDFGEKPNGWDTKPFSEVIAVNPPRKMARNSIAKKVEMSDLNLWQPWIESWSVDNYKSGSCFQNGDILFARITPCLENGKTALVSFLGENEAAFGSTEFIVLSPKIIRSSHYILFLAISKELRGSAILSMTGSSGRQRVPNDFFDNFVITVPPYEVLQKFDNLVAPMFEKITNNVNESRSLKAIRDNLLPRLMSGKIRVSVQKDNMETL